jgi:hypothetical protein
MAHDHDTDQFTIPDDAEKEEAAAIIAAVFAYLRNEELALDMETTDKSWTGKRWAFAGRLEEQKLRSGRVPLSAPVDAWTAAGRGDRY